jgi:hypothetical protein
MGGANWHPIESLDHVPGDQAIGGGSENKDAGVSEWLAFEQYVDKILAPTVKLRQLVILDNPAVHKRVAVRRVIEAAGAKKGVFQAVAPQIDPRGYSFLASVSQFSGGGGGIRTCDQGLVCYWLQ